MGLSIGAFGSNREAGPVEEERDICPRAELKAATDTTFGSDAGAQTVPSGPPRLKRDFRRLSKMTVQAWITALDDLAVISKDIRSSGSGPVPGGAVARVAAKAMQLIFPLACD